MKRHIPNTITCCNLICGCIATYFVLQPVARYDLALAFIVGGAVFDFFDGFMTRLLKVSSPIGKELDSLADCITFGMAPASVVFALLSEVTPNASVGSPVADFLPFVAFILAAFSALRLAKFNLDERQSTSFIGLPTPANALFWGALAYGAHDWLTVMPSALWILLSGILVSSFLLVAEIPMFALKFKNFGWHGNVLRYSFILAAFLLLIFFGWVAFAYIIVLYVLLSMGANIMKRNA